MYAVLVGPSVVRYSQCSLPGGPLLVAYLAGVVTSPLLSCPTCAFSCSKAFAGFHREPQGNGVDLNSRFLYLD